MISKHLKLLEACATEPRVITAASLAPRHHLEGHLPVISQNKQLSRAIEKQYRIRLFAETTPADQRSHIVTGHIDFLQVRNGAVHILDYKPDERTNKPITQLTVYALALARLTELNLFDIKCAWFNEKEYCEFFPRMLLGPQLGRTKG